MALVGFCVCPQLVSRQQLKTPRNLQAHKQHFSNVSVSACSKVVAEPSSPSRSADQTKKASFGFKNLIETLWVDVHGAEGRPLVASLTEQPSSTAVENVAVRVELSNGCVGWGEAVSDGSHGEKVKEVCEFLRQSRPMTLNLVLEQIGGMLPGSKFASVRAGVEMALIDAVANRIDVPLWRLFGGVSNSITTAVRIPVASPAKASDLASKYCQQGFRTFRIMLGKNLEADAFALQAIQEAHPNCSIIIDANGEYTSREAIAVLEKFHDMGVVPVLFEQPVHREDWKGLGEVSKVAWDKYGISVAADESCSSLLDVQRIVDGNLANVINIKLAKFGVLGALEVIEFVKKSGLNLMIDGMVETRVATGFAGHMAAGLGCFKYVGLDAPFLLSEDPVVGGYEVSGAVYKFNNARGQGGFLNWNSVAW